jgi:hypothetical protein
LAVDATRDTEGPERQVPSTFGLTRMFTDAMVSKSVSHIYGM